MRSDSSQSSEIKMQNSTEDNVNSQDEMIMRARQGDREALAQLYRSYRENVYRICLRMVRNPSDAEDLVQETFLRVINKIHTFRGDSQFSTWLYRVTKNVALMQLRKPKFATVDFEDSRDQDEFLESVNRASGVPEAEAHATDGVLLETAIQQLPSGYGKVLVLHDVLGYRHNEISKMTGITANNSKSRLCRARRMLRGVLQTPLPDATIATATMAAMANAASYDTRVAASA
ncbi:MAG: RNA polymerase sigma factor [Terracidiphilus sp.]